MRGQRKPADACYKPAYSSDLSGQDRKHIAFVRESMSESGRDILAEAPRLVAYGMSKGWITKPARTVAGAWHHSKD